MTDLYFEEVALDKNSQRFRQLLFSLSIVELGALLALLRDAKLCSNIEFLSLPPSQQSAKINTDKHRRYRDKYLPKWAVDLGIDVTDRKEVAQWKAIAFRGRYPFLSKSGPTEDRADQRVVLTNGDVLHEMYVSGITLAGEGETVGLATDTEIGMISVWCEQVENGVWKEIT